ncbi:MAG: HTH domain-containing protein [bacterium]
MIQARVSLSADDLQKTVGVLLSSLDARSRDIIVRRHGIESGSVETLESIGHEYGVTRERVRQIEAQAKKLLAKRYDVLDDVSRSLSELFGAHGGVLAEDHLIEIVKDTVPQVKPALVVFYLNVLSPYEYVTRSEIFGPHWSHPELHSKYVDAVVNIAETLLKRAKHPLEEAQLMREIRQQLSVSEQALPATCLYSLLRASKNLDKTVFGEWGLSSWVETKPRGVGDKAYIVLRRHGKPQHFREITDRINETSFDHKQAHAQTVHNELIKDDRFVLVGRGLYGLAEWGYIPGTVADVMETILNKAEAPMTREELLDKVLKQRMVKRTTILLGLQDADRFQKVSGDRYKLRT